MNTTKIMVATTLTLLFITLFVATITINIHGEKTQNKTSKISNDKSKLSNINTVIPQPGDYYNQTINLTTGSEYLYISLVFLNYVNSTTINGSVVYQTETYSGTNSILINGTFEMNENTLQIQNETGIDSWYDTTSYFLIHTGLSVGTHLQIGLDTNATIVGQTTYTLNNNVYDVQNVTFLDGGITPVFAYYEVNSGLMIHYQQINSKVNGWLNATSLLNLNQITNTITTTTTKTTQSNTNTSLSSTGTSFTPNQSNSGTNTTNSSNSNKSQNTITTTTGFDYQTAFILISFTGIAVILRKRKE